MKRSGEISALTALAIVALVGLGAYVWLTFTREGPPAWVTDPGVAKGAVHVGNYVVVIDTVTDEDHPTTRLTAIDATTGKRRKAMLEPDLVGCFAATADRMWCTAKSVELRDLPSLESALSAEGAIIDGSHGVPVTGAWVLEGGKLFYKLTSGRAVSIDPATLAITPAPALPVKQPRAQDASCAQLRVPLAGKTCESVALVGGVYVVTTTSPAERALGIDASTGAVRWTAGAP